MLSTVTEETNLIAHAKPKEYKECLEMLEEPPVHFDCKRHCPYRTSDGKYTDSAEEAFLSFKK